MTPKCYLCSRKTRKGFTPVLKVKNCPLKYQFNYPLCDECTISAFYQRALLWCTDIKRVLGYWPDDGSYTVYFSENPDDV